MACLLALGLTWLAATGLVLAQTGGLWTLYSAESIGGGPPSSIIYGLLAQENRLWVTTDAGIGCFDGHLWQSQAVADAAPGGRAAADWPFEWAGVLPPVTLVEQGDLPGIWFGTPYGIAVHQEDGAWAAFPQNDELPRSAVTALLAARDGTVWIGTQSGLARWDGHSLVDVDPPALGSSYYLALAEDAFGGLWAGTVADGLQYLNGDQWICFTGEYDAQALTSGCRHLLPGGSSLISALASDGAGGMWAGTSSGLAHMIGDEPQLLPPELAETTYEQEVLALWREEASGQLWIGLRSDLLVVTAQGIQQPVGAEMVSLDTVRAITGDAEGSVWLGTNDGLWRYRRAWEPLRPDGTTVPPGSGPIVQDGAGGLWFGLGEYAARLAPDGTWQHTEPVSATVNALLVDGKGRLWAGSDGGALRRTSTGWDPVSLSPEDEPVVYAAAPGAEGDVWLGTSDGLYHLAADGARLPVRSALDVPHSVYALLPGESGDLWAGTSNGLMHLPVQGEPSRYTVTDGLPDQSVHSLYRDRQGALWAGTRQGVARQQEGDAKPAFARPAGLAALDGQEIRAIAEDSLGRLWFGTRRGAYVYGGEQLVRFTLADGLASNDVLGLLQDREGRLWIATAGGVQQYRPGEGRPWAGFQLWAGNDPVSPRDGVLHVAWDKATGVRVELEGGDLSTAFGELVFCTRMAGLDDGQCNTDAVLPYNLIVGHDYTFQVTTLDEDGHSSDAVSLPVQVAERPLTQTPWFIALMAAVAAGLLVVAAYWGNILRKRWGEVRVQKDILLSLRPAGGAASPRCEAEVAIRHQGLSGLAWRWRALWRFDLAGVREPVEHWDRLSLPRAADLDGQLELLRQRLGLRETDRRQAEQEEQVGKGGLRPLGKALLDSAFPQPLIDLLTEMRQEGKRARIRLSFDLERGAELARLPWEYTYHPDPDLGFLAQRSHTALVRYLEVGQPPPPSLKEPLRILAIVASPVDKQPAIQTWRERERLEKALGPLIAKNRVKLEYLVGPAAAGLDPDLPEGSVATEALDDALSKRLDAKPHFHVLHFVGHAGPHDGEEREGVRPGETVLYGENADGEYLPLGRPQLVGLLSRLADQKMQPFLLFLNACQTIQLDGGQAMVGLVPELIARGKLPAVVGMQYPVGDAAATLFAGKFYEALLLHGQVDWAISIARHELAYDRGQDRPDWGMPVLYLQARNGIIFKTY